MTFTFSKFGTCAATACVAASLLCSSVRAADDDLRLDDAWKAAMEDQEGVLTKEQFGALNNLAYHSAVARVCDGFNLSLEKFSKAVNDIIIAGSDKLDDEEKLARQTHILVALGTSHGLFLAEGTLHKEIFCKEAATAKSDGENANLWE